MSTKPGWQGRAELDAAAGGKYPADPEWDHGVPLCSERCVHHDGKRCSLIGFRPGEVCQPAVMAMAEILDGHEPTPPKP
jgi:hypothetical protein